MRHFYGFVGLPNHWADDNDFSVNDRFFEDKEYVDYYFDNFFEMDKIFGHENSAFGTRGLPVGHPNRTSKSFDRYNERFGPAIVRVLKDSELNENIHRLKELMGLITEQDEDSDYEPCGRGGNMQIHPADLEFFREFFHVYGFLPYPKEMERLGKLVRIGDIYPEHPAAHLNTKSYYICKSKVFKEIRMSIAKELGLILAETRSGARLYKTNDGKYELRSIYEVIFYNIFLMNNEADNLEVDSRKFYGNCGEIQKEVDFIYKDETVIEIAGMVKPEYFNKLNSAMKCIESLGYNTIIYNTREMTRKSSYYEFYEKICQDFGFPVDEGMRYNVISLIGHNNLSEDTMKDFVDKHIATLKQLSPEGRKKWSQLDRYVKKLYGKGIREYRKDLGIKQNNR